MNHGEGHEFSPAISFSNRTLVFARDDESPPRGHVSPQRRRRPTVPPLSTRTLRHPSFMPVYVAAGFVPGSLPLGSKNHIPLETCPLPPIPVITPVELFFNDPTMSCGSRVPIVPTELRVLDCFRLNTPTPVMSAFPAPPSRPDPFRSGTHPTRDLGSPSLRANALRPPAGPRRVVVQLTQEEDQAVTNLLKLHHQAEPPWSHGALAGALGPLCSEVPRGDCWSASELEAADTLVSGFGPIKRPDPKPGGLRVPGV